jgi:hypothetical protein
VDLQSKLKIIINIFKKYNLYGGIFERFYY